MFSLDIMDEAKTPEEIRQNFYTTVLAAASLFGHRSSARMGEGAKVYMPSIDKTVPNGLYSSGLSELPTSLADKVVRLYSLNEQYHSLEDKENNQAKAVVQEIREAFFRLGPDEYQALNIELKSIVNNAIAIVLLDSRERVVEVEKEAREKLVQAVEGARADNKEEVSF